MNLHTGALNDFKAFVKLTFLITVGGGFPSDNVSKSLEYKCRIVY